MRFAIILLAPLLTNSLSAVAARRFSEDQLKQLLTAAQVLHRTDDAVVQQLAAVKLANRLSGAELQQILALSPGPNSTQALHAIADASAFLAPPADQLLATPAPDPATQKAIIARATDYVTNTMHSLPNFLASRVTESYVDTLRGIDQAQPERGGMYLLSTSSTPIGFRDGAETDDPVNNGAASSVTGMVSWGEFGPILGVVLQDVANGKLSWARWELEDGKPAAVFQFVVGRSTSHYLVTYCCDRTDVSASKTIRGIEGTLKTVSWKPGYHGIIELDPETGSILRLTIEADLRSEDPVQKSSIMVEYGQVKIGSGVHLCPIRSVALSVSSAEIESHGMVEHTSRLLLNDVEFTGYHRFGSESRVVSGAASNEPPASDKPDR